MAGLIGIVLYAFRSSSRVTRNRPTGEARFQVKYGPRTGDLQTIFDDPFKLYTTLMVGIDLESGVVVSADPAVHNPTRFYISIEYKIANANRALERGWHVWERVKREHEQPVEVLVGCAQEQVLDLILFERAAKALDQGHRHLLAEECAFRRSWAADPTEGGRSFRSKAGSGSDEGGPVVESSAGG